MRDETARRRETVRAFPYIEDRVSSSPREFLAGVGEIFAVFDHRTQDSGNASYGVEVGGRRYFVKTAGEPDDDDSARLNHAERVGLLRNAAELARSVLHPALPTFHGVVESPRAPMPLRVGGRASCQKGVGVFSLGRTAAIPFSDGSLNRAPVRGSDAQHEAMLTSCRQPAAEFRAAWTLTLPGTRVFAKDAG